MKEYYKKIDKSFFDGKVTIPNQYINCFVDPDEFDQYKSRNISIKFKGKRYSGKYCFVHQSTGRKVLQISYDNKLIVKLKQEFIQTYFAIESQKLLKEKDRKFQTKLLGGSQEVAIFKSIDNDNLELETFIKIETAYDNIFKALVEQNVFGWLSNENNSQMITKYSSWMSIDELPKYADTPYVVYYLLDETNNELYIGSAQRLGDRVKVGRHEIPNWNKFMFEIIHPDFHSMLKEIEYHSIMTFSKFLKNNGNRCSLGISNYKLVNKDYKYYRD